MKEVLIASRVAPIAQGDIVSKRSLGVDLLEISEGRIVICQGKWWLCGESPQGLQLRVGVARRPHSTCLFTTGGIECRCAQFKVFVVMVSRYPSAILWHGLDFGGRDTPVTTILKPTRAPGNNAGLGPPVARSIHQPRRTWLDTQHSCKSGGRSGGGTRVQVSVSTGASSERFHQP